MTQRQLSLVRFECKKSVSNVSCHVSDAQGHRTRNSLTVGIVGPLIVSIVRTRYSCD